MPVREAGRLTEAIASRKSQGNGRRGTTLRKADFYVGIPQET